MEQQATTNSTYSLPAFLSLFIPGIGQILKKHWWRAAAMIVCLLLLIRSEYNGLQWFGLFFVAAHAVLAIWSCYDAYNAQRDWK